MRNPEHPNEAPAVYAYSLDGYTFTGSFESRPASVYQARRDPEFQKGEGDAIYTGRLHAPRPSEMVLMEALLESIRAGAYEHGYQADGWLESVSEAPCDDLKRLLDDWAARWRLLPRFYRIEAVCEHDPRACEFASPRPCPEASVFPRIHQGQPPVSTLEMS